MENQMESQPAAGALRTQKSYGACPSKEDAEKRECEREQLEFTDSELMTLPLIIFSMCFLSFAIFNSLVVGVLSSLYGTAIASILTYLSWERSRAWRIFCLLLWLAELVGLCLGIASCRSFPPFSNGHINDRAVVASVCVLSSFVLLSKVVCEALPALGCGIVGSSEEFAKGKVEEGQGWGWEPLALKNMHMGWDFHVEEVPDRVTHDLLFKRAYWSGEPAVDYLFFVAQEHLYMSCFLSHPCHPFRKLLRFIVAVLVSCLVVWPVALMAETVPDPLKRLVLTVILVTAPRNLLKATLRKVAVSPQMLKVRDEASIQGGKFRRLVRKHITKNDCSRFASAVIEARQAYTTQKLIGIVLFSICLTGYVIYACTQAILHHSQRPVYDSLVQSAEGLLFAFTLELLIQLVFTARQKDGPRRKMLFCGFFHRWWVERRDYGKLRHVDKLARDDEQTCLEHLKDAVSMALEG